MSTKRVEGRIRFLSVESFDEWKKCWLVHSGKYDFPEEFESFSDCKWRKALINVDGQVCVWEIFSTVASDVVETSRVAILADEMKYIEYRFDEHPSVQCELDARISTIIDQISDLRNELCRIAESGNRLTFLQYSQIKDAIGE